MDFEIVQIVQELSNAGGVETLVIELARVFTRHGLPNVVLASAVGGEVDRTLRLERGAPWLKIAAAFAEPALMSRMQQGARATA